MIQVHRHPPGLAAVEPPLGPQATIHPGCEIRDSRIGAWTELMRGTRLVESSFGDYSYTDEDVSIIYTDVGRFCSIAARVRINPGNHPMERPTQHHLVYRRRRYGLADRDDTAFFDWRRSHRCHIGHDVWIGHAAVVMPGVRIGTGAVVGAGAVVTRDVLPYQIVAGVPARPVRLRFDGATIERLLAIAWWDWDRATLEARFDELMDLELMLERHRAAGPVDERG
jgi:phosphonate metabolism protein (transferase hexapeptide repeat family)